MISAQKIPFFTEFMCKAEKGGFAPKLGENRYFGCRMVTLGAERIILYIITKKEEILLLFYL